MIVLLLCGCSSKPEYIHIKPKAYPFVNIPQPKIREIRVHKADQKLYEAYIKNFREIIDTHNQQIEDYKNSLKEIK
jgi:hypothetical protein